MLNANTHKTKFLIFAYLPPQKKIILQNLENTKTKESESKIAETILEEDNRFEIPTDQSSIQQQQQQQQKSDVLFTDGTSGNNNNNNNNNNNANNSELFTTQSNDLETRLK